ncbi:MAG: hypothetical protein ACREGC_02365 [Minisyncoccia bacterium]
MINPKLLLCLALAAFAFTTQQVRAFDEPYEVNRTNIATPYFSFLLVKAIHIHPTNNDEMVVFRIIVMPKDKHRPEYFGAVLSVKDDKNYILAAQLRKEPEIINYPEIPKPIQAKSVMFEFSISVKYLSNSEVELNEGLGIGCGYLIKLKDFANGS